MLAIAAILALCVLMGQSSGQVWTDKQGNTYEIIVDQRPSYNQQRPAYPQQQQQQYYPRRPYYPQQQQRPFYPQQQYPNQNNQQYNQQSPGVSVANAEWVCTNTRTKDVMIIAAEDIPGSRFNAPVTSQPNNPQPQPGNQPTYPQPQPGNQPTYPQPQPGNQPTYPQPQPGNQPTYPQPPNNQPSFPNQNLIPTTQRPVEPIWPDVYQTTTAQNPNWPVGDGGNSKPGFTVAPETAPKTTPKPTTTQALPDEDDDDDDDEPIKIDFGK